MRTRGLSTCSSRRFRWTSLSAAALFALALISGHIVWRAVRVSAARTSGHAPLTFAERVAYQRAIEDVYWRHRIWPAENPNAKPPLDAVMPSSQIESRVEDYLRKSHALEVFWQLPITAESLQAEMD